MIFYSAHNRLHVRLLGFFFGFPLAPGCHIPNRIRMFRLQLIKTHWRLSWHRHVRREITRGNVWLLATILGLNTALGDQFLELGLERFVIVDRDFLLGNVIDEIEKNGA